MTRRRSRRTDAAGPREPGPAGQDGRKKKRSEDPKKQKTGGEKKMALRNILNLNDAMDAEILRKKSRPVEKIDERIRTILDDMAETLYDSGGVGLAAPQVGILRRIVVIDIGRRADRTHQSGDSGDGRRQGGCGGDV